MRQLNRRDFLRVTAGALAVGALSSCAPKVVEKIVKETVEVEKVVKETVEVEKVVKETVEVEKVVKETVVVKEAPLSRIARLDGKAAVLWGLQYDPHVEVYNRMAAYFKGLTGATLKVEPQGWPLETKLIAALSAGTQPDIACIMGKMCTPLYIQDILLPLDELVYDAMEVVPEEVMWLDAVQAYTWQGKMYGVPFETGAMGIATSVPVEDVEKVGLADKYPPTNGEFWFESYESMWQLAKTLQDELGMEGDRVARWGLSSKGWEDSSYLGILDSLLEPKGTTWWDLGQQKFNVATDEGVQAMKLLVETPVKMGIETELDQTHVDAALAGKVFIARGAIMPCISGRGLGFPYDPAGAPRLFPGKKPLVISEGGWGWVTPKNARNMDVAVEFLKMMVTIEGQWENAHIYGGRPWVCWKALAGRFDYWADPNPETNPIIKFAAVMHQEVLPIQRYYGEGFGYASGLGMFGQVCSEVRQQNMSAEQGCDEVQSRLEAQRKQFLADIEEMKG